MALAPGARLGVYEITAQIGEGGMGSVYRATDTTLGRQVAIKILPDAFAADPDRVARFEREAKTLALLNHPHIAAIYGFEKSAGLHALVMELVEGEDLSQRIARGAIPVDEALPIARQIAEALEAAHEQGIIHRDLKPANIKLRSDGTVKVLDFGLAKAMEPVGTTSPSMSMSPTITTPAMTQAGMILGTAAYMSPEQARGKTVDKRADIWAFGCVLFEMLTGERAFAGDDVSEVLASVLAREPDWNRVPQAIAPTQRVFLRRCLQKDLKQRVGDVHDLRLALEGAFDKPVSQETAQASVNWMYVAVITAVATTALVASIVTASVMRRRADSNTTNVAPTRLSVMLPTSRPISIVGSPARSIAMSPDGTLFVYVCAGLDASADQLAGRTQLCLRSIGSLAVHDLPGTSDARQPFFAPDGRSVGFFTGTGELKKVALAGGRPVTLVQRIGGSGNGFGVWTADNRIIFSAGGTGLRLVPGDGGNVVDLTTVDAAHAEDGHQFPALVPSQKAVLFSVRYVDPTKRRIDAVELTGGNRHVVVENARAGQFAGTNHLLFERDDAVLVAPFDHERIVVSGPAVPIVDTARLDGPNGLSPMHELVVSQSGSLAYVPVADTATVMGVVSRNGMFEALGPEADTFAIPRVSPDGQMVAFVVSRGTSSETHVYDTRRGTTTRLTQAEFDLGIAWHPDGRSLAISSRRKGTNAIFLKGLDGLERTLLPFPEGVTWLRNASWSPDGKHLAYTSQRANGDLGIWTLTTGEPPSTQPFVTSNGRARSPAFSPDGQWLAYSSDESGRFEVYAQKYPQGEKLQVSSGGGAGPVWRRGGREIFFQGQVNGAPTMMAASVTLAEGTPLKPGRPVPLFSLRVMGPTGVVEQYAGDGNFGPGYDVLPDGRFLMVRSPDQTSIREIVVVQNWFEEVKGLAPPK